AGENLARDFCSAGATVDAWMNSPTHRENMLSENYKEIGIGVLEGNLAGADTTLVVQFFGSSGGATVVIPVAKAQGIETTATIKPIATVKPTPVPTLAPTPTPISTGAIAISPFKTTKDISMAAIGVLLLVLSIDLIVVRRKRIARIGGRTLAHIAYLGMILAVVLILKAGQII
ncbi:MAG: CAP domain-containing protein, partial [bacterium]|nr:CAP domain-containing protein [bacterium]